VKALRTSSVEPIPFFTFDHALKDPSPSDKPVTTDHKIVIVEGLYTLLDRPGWREAADMMDLRVWIEVDRAIARRRVVERNYAAGISATREDTAVRVDASDMLNGEDVRANRVEPTDIVHSIDDPRIS
jgi:pantothenate kinase